MEKKDLPQQESHIYRTGSTRPPKSYGGIIAVLLVLVIFLCGINSVLSLMNIRLFRQLQKTNDPDISAGVVFSTEDPCANAPDPATPCITFPFGFHGCTLSGFDQMLYDLPQGIYVTAVIPDSYAYRHGVQPGDILVRLNDRHLTDARALVDLLEQLRSGETVSAEFIRDDTTIVLELRVD